MPKSAATEFEDRGGKTIYVGDIVQYRLNALTQGATRLLVARNKKGLISLVDPRSASKKGLHMSKTYEKYVVIVDTSGRSSVMQKD